jgi:hypothetical protein
MGNNNEDNSFEELFEIQKPVESLILPIKSNFCPNICIPSRDPVPSRVQMIFKFLGCLVIVKD